MPCESVNAFVSVCVRVVSRASRIFSACEHAHSEVGGETEGKNIWVDVPGVCGSVVCVGCLPRVHNDYYLM